MYEIAQDLFAIAVASLGAAAVFAYKFSGRTVVYVDISGSMCGPTERAAMKEALDMLRLRNGVLKVFDHQVREIGPYTKKVVDHFFAKNISGGGSSIDNVVNDFRASGAKRAIVLTDEMFYSDNPELDLTGVRVIKVI